MRKRIATFALVSVFVAAGCGGDGGSPTAPTPPPTIAPPPTQPPPPGGGPTVTSVSIEGQGTVEEGDTLQLRAVARRSDGTSQDVSPQAVWRSSNAAIGTVSATGLVTAVAAGSTDISADFGGATGRRTLNVVAALWDVQVSLTSLVVLESCDDFTQGLTDAELAYKISVVQTSGQETVLRDSGYPGSQRGDDIVGAQRIREGNALSIPESRTFRLRGEDGQFLRVEFRATEWDEQIVIIPPSIRWVRDGRMNDRLGTTTHRFTTDRWSPLGNTSITIGASGCRARLDYRVTATR